MPSGDYSATYWQNYEWNNAGKIMVWEWDSLKLRLLWEVPESKFLPLQFHLEFLFCSSTTRRIATFSYLLLNFRFVRWNTLVIKLKYLLHRLCCIRPSMMHVIFFPSKFQHFYVIWHKYWNAPFLKDYQNTEWE